MAAPSLRRLAWPLLAVSAGAVLVALALHGSRPAAGFARYEPGGIMLELAPARVSVVEVVREGRRRRLVRGDAGWRAEGLPRPDPSLSDDVERALRFLHGSAPQRVLAPEELEATSLADLGLSPPRLVVSVLAESGPPFVVELGAANPQGLAHYARVAGRRELFLLNRYVGEAWLKVAP